MANEDKNKVNKAPTEPPKAAPKEDTKPTAKQRGAIKVIAVIRPMHSPVDNVLIPEAVGVLIKKSTWATSQLERGLLRIVK